MSVFTRVRMPSLGGATGWLNSEPLGPAELRGHVVLVNFWTLTCINWLRQEPYVRAWSQAYRNDGLVVIGVHTPEFSFEHEIDRVRQATKERGIDYPVVVDNDYAIWSAFDNHYWPALYFVDADGIIRDHHFGEGRYEQSERVIQRLLGVERELIPVEGLGVEAEADWDNLRTPETYLGYGRSEHFAFHRAWDTMMAQNEQRKNRPLTMPVLGIGGEASGGEQVGSAMKVLANDMQTAVIPGAGHWLAEEAPRRRWRR
jgi:pimeloyl-ACP methyl ester carboxylesterase